MDPTPDNPMNFPSTRLRRRHIGRLLAVTLLIALPVRGHEGTAPPEGLMNLSASAQVEVPRDVMTVTLATTREGTDPAAVQGQLRQALDTALLLARRAARPGQIDVQTGNFTIQPRYAAGARIAGWQGTAELVVEGRDMAAIAQLAGSIGTMTVARVGYGLSRDVREQAEAEVGAQAIDRYRAKAAAYARQFGFAGYALREVQVSTNESAPVRPQGLQMRSAGAMVDEALPVEAGKGTVSVTVSGSVQMKPSP